MRMPLRRQGIQQPTERLFGLFWPLTVAQAHSWATTVLVDEFDAREFKCAPNDIEGRATRLTDAGPNRRLGFAALQGLLKRHANKALIGNSLFFCSAAHG